MLEHEICPMALASALDSGVRKLFHNPKKILKPYVHEGMAALDLGCGPGFFSIEMARLIGKSGNVVAADVQQGMLDIVRKKIKKLGIENIQLHKSEGRIGLKQKFDFVLMFYMLHEVPKQDSLLHEVKTLLKPEGKVLIVEPKFHVSRKTFDNSIETVKAIGFRIIEKPRVFLSRSILLGK